MYTDFISQTVLMNSNSSIIAELIRLYLLPLAMNACTIGENRLLRTM